MSSLRRVICWVLGVAAGVAGMLVVAGSMHATIGPGYEAVPKSGAFTNFVTLPSPSRAAVDIVTRPPPPPSDPCLVHPHDPGCSDSSEVVPHPHPHPHPHPYPFPYPHPHPYPHGPDIPYIPPIRIPPVCQAIVPNLINLTEDQARRAVTAVGLTLVSDHPGNNRILSQTPFAGTKVLCGWTIAVTVDVPPPAPVEIPSPEPAPVIVLPPPPTVVPPAIPVSHLDPMPWFWPLIFALLALCAALLLGLLLLLTTRARKGPKWVHAHVRAVAAATAGPGIDVMESRTDHSPPTCAVRLEPNPDRGQQILEEVNR